MRMLFLGQLLARSRRRPRSGESTIGRRRVRIASSVSAALMPSGVGLDRPATSWPFRPATRTWKNSSRLLAKMARNRTRSSSGLRSSIGLEQDAIVELEPRQLAVDVRDVGDGRATAAAVARGALSRRRGRSLGDGRRLRGSRRPRPLAYRPRSESRPLDGSVYPWRVHGSERGASWHHPPPSEGTANCLPPEGHVRVPAASLSASDMPASYPCRWHVVRLRRASPA